MRRGLLLALFLSDVATAAPESLEIRRFALIAGANDGGAARVRLAYANTDAASVAHVLVELGGVRPEDQVLLLEPSRDTLDQALIDLAARIDAAGEVGRSEVIVYYSGHSDERGLLLGGDEYGYDELRRHLDGLPADVRIAILDSCASGALVRGKGGVQRPSFLIDESNTVAGHAFLTSSSADEAAQESDAIGSSFFTHYLVSGLRGAADMSGDGNVTLNEAYHFAFTETLARTERTQAGAQHPAYDIQLSGTGDLVMTSLFETAATLVVGENVDGRLFVRDEVGHLDAELYKAPGRLVELGLDAGRYEITLDQGGALARASVTLGERGHARLDALAFDAIVPERTASRGSDTILVPFSASFVPPLDTNGVQRDLAINQMSFNGISGRSFGLDGLEFAFGFNTEIGDVKGAQFAFGGNVVGGRAEAVQSAFGFNIADGAVTGAQLGMGFNLAGPDSTAVQTAFVFNATRGDLRGAQVTPGFNVAYGVIDGVQVSSLNLAGGIRGMQIGLINIGGDVSGSQIGVVNIARDVNGAQVGLVNISRDLRGAPIGVLNIVRRGRFDVEVWATDIEAANLGIKWGSKSLYTLVALGTTASGDRMYGGVGVGGHLEGKYHYLDMDLSARETLYDFVPGDLVFGQARVAGGIYVFKRIAPFVGFSGNVQVQNAEQTTVNNFEAIGPSRVQTFEDGTVVRMWPGVLGGLQF
jgi:hypothetical protein